MSFILDALKKSELERQRQAIPGLMDSRLARSRARLPLWAIGLMALLAVNLAVLTVVLTRGGAPTAAGARAQGPAPAGAPSPGALKSEPAKSAEHFSPLDAPSAAPIYAPEIPVSPAADSMSGESAGPAQGSAGAAGAGGARAAHRRDPVLIEQEDRAANEVLPTLGEINTGQEPLPELHLDVHVYATDPADRFVYINGRKYHEGATLEEGLKLERIRRDGVVLDLRGLRFLLPRQ